MSEEETPDGPEGCGFEFEVFPIRRIDRYYAINAQDLKDTSKFRTA
jgi:hypothetical protein